MASDHSTSRSGSSSARNLGTLQDHAPVGPVIGKLDGLVEQRLVFHYPTWLDPTRRGDDDLRPGIIDPDGELSSRESAKHDRVHHPQPGTSKHRDDGFGHHRHIDDRGVTFGCAQSSKGAGKAAHHVEQLTIAIALLGSRNRTVVDEGNMVTTATRHMTIDSVVARVQQPIREPPIERRRRIIKHDRRLHQPIDALSCPSPEHLRLVDALPIHHPIANTHKPPPVEFDQVCRIAHRHARDRLVAAPRPHLIRWGEASRARGRLTPSGIEPDPVDPPKGTRRKSGTGSARGARVMDLFIGAYFGPSCLPT